MFPRNMVCLRNISVDTLHKGDTEDNNNNNNNNNIKKLCLSVYKDNLFTPKLICISQPRRVLHTRPIHYILYNNPNSI